MQRYTLVIGLSEEEPAHYRAAAWRPPAATGGGPQFTQTRQKLSIQAQARRSLLHCGL